MIRFCLLLLCIFQCSCTDIVTHHLNKGLDELENSRVVNEEIIKDFELKGIGIFKLDDGSYKIAFKLNENITNGTVTKYSLGVHVKVWKEDEHFLPKGKNYISWDCQPILEEYGDYKYIIIRVRTKIERIKSLRVFLYNRGKYKEQYGKNVIIRNIRL